MLTVLRGVPVAFRVRPSLRVLPEMPTAPLSRAGLAWAALSGTGLSSPCGFPGYRVISLSRETSHLPKQWEWETEVARTQRKHSVALLLK